jgi:hypothetical protein
MLLDLIGKRGRVRSIKLWRAVKSLIDRWLEASGREVQLTELYGELRPASSELHSACRMIANHYGMLGRLSGDHY